MNAFSRAFFACALALTLPSCALIKAPIRLLGGIANTLLKPIGGLGGAARVAPLLLDAKDGSRKPIRGVKTQLDGGAPSQTIVNEQEVAKAKKTAATLDS
jgi:hypothetical protein